MQELFQSAFLQALGKSIAASIWQTGLLFLMYQLLVFLFRIQKASVKNFLATVFAFGGLTWFLATIFSFVSQPASTLIIEHTAANNQLLQSFTQETNWQTILKQGETLITYILPYLSVAYMFILLWFVIKLSFQLYAANNLRYKGTSNANDELQAYFELLVQSLGIQQNIRLFISSQIDIPATIGFLKPIVLLPVSAVTHLTPAQLEAVLIHELSHIQRNDYFWNLLLCVSETLLFFNPFALLLIGIARRERENSCDDMVMNYQQNAQVYAEALLNVEKARLQSPKLAMALGDNKHHLMHRVKRILNLPAEKNKISTRLLALLLFTVVFAMMGWIVNDKQQSNNSSLRVTKNKKFNTNIVSVSPNTLVTNNNHLVTLRDETKNITLAIKKESSKDQFVIQNKDGEQRIFDEVIFNETAEETADHMTHPDDIRFPGFSEIYQQPVYEFTVDSMLHSQYRLQETTELLKELKELQTRSRNKRLIELPKMGSMLSQLQNIPSVSADQMLKVFQEQDGSAFLFNEYFKDFHLNGHLSTQEWNKAKETATKQWKEKYRKPQLYYKKIITKDSAQQKNRARENASRGFAYSYVIPDYNRENTGNQNVNIEVADEFVFINGSPVHLQDSVGERQLHRQPKRIVKRLQVIRL
jgi:beta-lactamase regulating signal transducer with metallopeptidase domain